LPHLPGQSGSESDALSVRVFAVLGSVFIIGTVFYLLEGVLMPFVAAWVLAYLLVPLVDLLDRRMPRWLAIVISFLALIAVLGGLFYWLVPELRMQINAFIAQLPGYVEQLDRALGRLTSHLDLKMDISAMSRILENRLAQLGNHLLNAPSELMSTAAELIKTVAFISLVPLVAFFLLRDWHWLVQGLESFVRASRRSTVEEFMRMADEVLRHYIHGLLLVMLGIGVMYTVGFGLTGISLWLVLGIMAGVVCIIPLASFLLSGIPAIALAAIQFHDFLHPLMILATIAVAEGVGNGLLMPVLVGRFVRVHPAAVLLFIFAGGALFGVLGMLLALPLAAMAAAWISRLQGESVPPGEAGESAARN
jgi:predicted PurR-regulated permease PerM